MKAIVKKTYNTTLSVFNFLKFVFFKRKVIKNSEIVFFFPYYHTGGAERVHIAILNAVKDKKCTVIFTLGSATNSLYAEFEKFATIIELNPIINKRNQWVNKLLQTKIISIINSSNQITSVFGCNSAYYYQIVPSIKKTILKNDLFHNFFDNDTRENDVVNSACYIDNRIVINEAAKQDIIKFYIKNNIEITYYDKIKIINNGIELSKNELKENIKKAIKIGFIGRWCFEKRPELFLAIAKNIKIKYPTILFVMAGTGMKSNLNLITNAGVEFLGEITDKKKLNELYSELDFVLLPSIYEGFPLVIMESMSYGVIPIVTNLDGVREHIVSGYNGLLINELDEIKIIEAFCNSIIQLIESPETRNDLRSNCFSYAHKNFGIDKFNQSYKNIFS